ncbi:uncharacterized protein F5147DRAFT_719762 [Suillus discolor]|uniref:Uncharacterized protein n=1 Tax=Suillus discolor TaxID=1912936 RepID=A0A9P7EWR6_9AGAM|nr:uncharacterized protein F5147DRAFT_719762 [Suillus discolor]KAG2094447.1 hypothetical protein F5147DRAFT_719762 [Suillus discolor]
MLLRDSSNLLQSVMDSPRIALTGNEWNLFRRMIQLDGRGLLLLSTRLSALTRQQTPSQRTRPLILPEPNPPSTMLASMTSMPVTCQWMHSLIIWLPGVNTSVLTAVSMQMADFCVQTTPKSMMWVTLLPKMWRVARIVVDASQIRCMMISGPISA